MTTYELTYIVSPEVTSEDAENKAKEIENAIQKSEGVILKQTNPSAKTLSYQIKKRASGFFGILEFQIEPEKILEVESMVRKDAKIVRHMVLIKKPVIIKKQRRLKKDILPSNELPSIEAKTEKPKIDLEDIDKQLDEILGE